MNSTERQTLKQQQGFSLLEVLFSISFLVLVGFAVIALNVATLRLVTDSEVKTTAYALNDEALDWLRLKYKTLTTPAFTALVTPVNCLGTGCFVRCSVQTLSEDCSLQSTAQPAQLGKSRLQFVRRLKLTAAGSGYLVRSTVQWGSGFNRQVQTSHYLQ